MNKILKKNIARLGVSFSATAILSTLVVACSVSSVTVNKELEGRSPESAPTPVPSEGKPVTPVPKKQEKKKDKSPSSGGYGTYMIANNNDILRNNI